MTPLSIESIDDKLFRLKANTDLLEDIVKKDGKDLPKGDVDANYYAIEHLLQLSIQIILDIGIHILAQEFDENPKNYAEVISALGERNVVTKDFAESNVEMAKFRNMIVHNYDNVDKVKVITYAKSAPHIFRDFGRAFVDFFRKIKD